MLLEGCLENIYWYLHALLVSIGDIMGSEFKMIRTENTNYMDRS